MSEPTPHKPKVTLEELLRLKRHERPPAEYWARFDRELNERVWQALAEPAESWASSLLGWFGRHVRMMSLGAVSILVLALTWYGAVHSPAKPGKNNGFTLKVASVPAPVVQTSDAAAAVPNSNNNAEDLAAAAENNLPAVTHPVLVAANVLDSSNLAGFHKIPAMLAFASSEGAGVSYASDTLSNPAFSAHVRGSAY